LGLFVTNLKVLVEPNIRGGDISFFKIKGSCWERIANYITTGTQQKWIWFIGIFEAIWLFARYVLCFFTLYSMALQRKLSLLCFFCSYLFYFSMITGHDGCARFRMMFEFLLIILAALGVVICLKKAKSLIFVKDY